MNFRLYTFPFLIISFLLISSCDNNGKLKNKDLITPENLYGELFYAVQSQGVFKDSKTFVDCIPLKDPLKIRDEFQLLENKSDSATLREFVAANFLIPESTHNYKTDSSEISKHIAELWPVLTRPADTATAGTLIPLPEPYVVPGGRFREIYYWDTYFTMLGLQADEEDELIRNMTDNFAFLIDNLGHIPNGNRTYYISRSQPPFFALMIEMLANIEQQSVYEEFLPYLEKEYEFWMKGSEQLTAENRAINHCVLMPDGSILNRYWDSKDTPRPESYLEDVATAEKAVLKNPAVTKEAVYRNLRSAAESGWDFSSRWMKQDSAGDYQLSTIYTTEIVPVDLNSLLYKLERILARAYFQVMDRNKANLYYNLADKRKEAVQKYLWNDSLNYYTDLHYPSNSPTDVRSLAGIYPLFVRIADKQQANYIADQIENDFLKPGGLVTTLNETGEQWDAPNGWAPLQWIGITSLKNYGYRELADEITSRWMKLNEKVYYSNYKLLEKYNVVNLDLESGGGEYPTQDGFGWTNGVYQALQK